jgi:hypothetical protein
VREKIKYRFRVSSAAVFTLYSYSKALEYRFRVSSAGSLKLGVIIKRKTLRMIQLLEWADGDR